MDIYWQEFEACLDMGYSVEEAKEIALKAENDIYGTIDDMIEHIDNYNIIH